MKTKRLVFILTGAFFFASRCGVNECENTKSWINDAPTAFEEFLLVKREILANPEFQHQVSFKKEIFLRAADTGIYNPYNLPHLKEWFRKGRGYISMEEMDTSCCFKECQNGADVAYGHIYYKKRQNNYKSSVKFIGSRALKNGWFAEVVECEGCLD